MRDSAELEGEGFAVVEHTADVGLRIWGTTLPTFLEQAVAGMAHLLVDRESIEVREEMRFRISCLDYEEGLVALLQEVLYLYEVKRFVPHSARIDVASDTEIAGVIRGEPFDENRHCRLMGIKAATYHDLRIERRSAADHEECWSTMMIFDI